MRLRIVNSFDSDSGNLSEDFSNALINSDEIPSRYSLSEMEGDIDYLILQMP